VFRCVCGMCYGVSLLPACDHFFLLDGDIMGEQLCGMTLIIFLGG
jgi:hypothetical protein